MVLGRGKGIKGRRFVTVHFFSTQECFESRQSYFFFLHPLLMLEMRRRPSRVEGLVHLMLPASSHPFFSGRPVRDVVHQPKYFSTFSSAFKIKPVFLFCFRPTEKQQFLFFFRHHNAPQCWHESAVYFVQPFFKNKSDEIVVGLGWSWTGYSRVIHCRVF